MSGRPRLEFSGNIFLPRFPQFRHDSRVLRRQPVVELIQRFDGRQNLLRDLDHFTCHAVIVRPGLPKHNPSITSDLTKKVTGLRPASAWQASDQ